MRDVISGGSRNFFRVVIKKLKLIKILIKIKLEHINITKKKKAQIHKVLKFPLQVFIF